MREKNIIFIGMPGCGKSVMAKLIAKNLNREHIDTDKVIEIRHKKSPSEIITTSGEAYFRDEESKIIRQYSTLCGKVISTGGGAVLRPENRKYLKKSGFVIFIKRDLSDLSQKNRPLSRGTDALQKMYEIRLPLYEETADCEIENNSTIEECVRKITDAILKYNK